MEAKIDLSPQALKEHRELAERARFRHPDTRKESDLMAFMDSMSAEFVIAMIDEIERLRSVEGFKKDFMELMDVQRLKAENERLRKENEELKEKM